jgi:hypothetical protein
MEALAEDQWPTRAQMSEYLEQHADEVSVGPVAELDQVFLSRQARGVSLLRDARAMAERLRATDATVVDAMAYGDPSMSVRRHERATARDLEARYGRALADTALVAPIATWVGPWNHRAVLISSG